MSDDSVLLITGDVVGGHPSEEIVGVIVLAHVLEAEPPIFSLPQPPLGGAMRRRRLAVGPFAGRAMGTQPPVLVRLYADAIEQGRVVFHDRSVCAHRRASFKA